jgi:hypothetical protein
MVMLMVVDNYIVTTLCIYMMAMDNTTYAELELTLSFVFSLLWWALEYRSQ